MMVASADDPSEAGAPWNPEGEDLTFLRDEGLEFLALFKSLKDPHKRKLVVDLLRLLSAEPPKR